MCCNVFHLPLTYKHHHHHQPKQQRRIAHEMRELGLELPVAGYGEVNSVSTRLAAFSTR